MVVMDQVICWSCEKNLKKQNLRNGNLKTFYKNLGNIWFLGESRLLEKKNIFVYSTIFYNLLRRKNSKNSTLTAIFFLLFDSETYNKIQTSLLG